MPMDGDSSACRSQRPDAASGQPPADAQATNGSPAGLQPNLLASRLENKDPGKCDRSAPAPSHQRWWTGRGVRLRPARPSALQAIPKSTPASPPSGQPSLLQPYRKVPRVATPIASPQPPRLFPRPEARRRSTPRAPGTPRKRRVARPRSPQASRSTLPQR